MVPWPIRWRQHALAAQRERKKSRYQCPFGIPCPLAMHDHDHVAHVEHLGAVVAVVQQQHPAHQHGRCQRPPCCWWRDFGGGGLSAAPSCARTVSPRPCGEPTPRRPRQATGSPYAFIEMPRALLASPCAPLARTVHFAGEDWPVSRHSGRV